jgi:hypothetical protein
MMRALAVSFLLLAAAPALAKPPAWDRKIDSPKRFKLLKAFDSDAVLDQETGLVWERVPDPELTSWSSAFIRCATLTIGQRGGWRLPTVYEIRTLVPYELQGLPLDHPFAASNEIFWTGTTVPGFDSAAFVSDLSNTGANLVSAA